jgi:hypothetical protein
MLVGADDGVIDEMHVPIELAGGIGWLFQGIEQLLKDAGLPPVVEAARYRAPAAIALRQVGPGGAGAENPQHAVKNAAVVAGWSSRLGFLWGKQRLEPLPLGVSQVSSGHSTQ